MRKIISPLMVIGLLLFSVGSGASFGGQKSYKLLDTETYLEMESVGSPSISPDGKHILFTRGWVNKMNDRSSSNLWIVDAKGLRVRELTHGNWRDFSPVWSPDGKKIAFLSDRDGTTQIHVLWLDTREVAQLTHLERAPGNLRWSPDGKTIAYFSDASGEYELHIKSQDGKAKPKVFPLTGTGFYAFPEWSPASKKICFVDNGRNIYLLDILSGGEVGGNIFIPAPPF